MSTLTAANARFSHVRKPRLNYTLAYTFAQNGNSLDVSYGVAQCYNRDTFSRKGGTERALGRLNKAIQTGKQNKMFGSFSVQNVEGLSVSREVASRYEQARLIALAEANANANANDFF